MNIYPYTLTGMKIITNLCSDHPLAARVMHKDFQYLGYNLGEVDFKFSPNG